MDHIFYLKDTNGAVTEYWGTDSAFDDKLFVLLDYGNNLIDKFKSYYELSYGNRIPRPHLFIINRAEVNAFAVWEKSLDEYCIGVYRGAIQKIAEKVDEIVDMVIEESSKIPPKEQLIPQEEREVWVEHVFIDAMRFFVAHEYAHILCGHVDSQEKVVWNS